MMSIPGKGMGSGGKAGDMLRVVGRACRVRPASGSSVQECNPRKASNNTTTTSPRAGTAGKSEFSNDISLSSASPLSAANAPPVVTSGVPITRPAAASGVCCDEFEWVSVDCSEDERAFGVVDDFVLGSVPSTEEVRSAVSALQLAFDASPNQFVWDKFAYPLALDKDVSDQISSSNSSVRQVSSAGSEIDWMEPSAYQFNSRMLQPYGYGRVYDAFHLLQTDPSVQRMVVSLSSDPAVWDAVLNNDVVREIRNLYHAADVQSAPVTPEISDGTCPDSNATVNMVSWIFDNTKAKIMEVIENIMRLVNQVFKLPQDEKTTAGTIDPFEKKLRTSFLLSVMVLLVVVMGRGWKASPQSK